MADRTVRVKFEAQVASYRAALGQVADDTRKWESQTLASARKNEQAWKATGMAMVGVGVGTGFALTKMVGVAADFEKQMSGVASVSNASASEMKALGDAAMEMGADVNLAGVTASSAAQAEMELAKAGIATADILGGALKGSLSLAVAGQLEQADAATIAAQAMNLFKLEGRDVGHVADVLAAGANKSAADVGELGAALRQGGLLAAQTGLTLEETVGTLSAFADNALIGSDAGTSLKTMLQRLTPQSAEAQGMFEQLGFSAFDAAGEFVGMEELAGRLQTSFAGMDTESRNAALGVMFGADAVRGANVVMNLGTEGISDYVTAVDDQGAAARMAAIQTDNLRGDLEALGGAWESLMIDMGQNAQGGLRGVAQALTDVVTGMGELPEAAQTTVIGVGTATTAVGVFGGGFMLALPKIAAFKASLATVGPTAQLAGNALLRFGGPAALALTVASAGLAIYAQRKGEAVARTNEFIATLDEETGALTRESREIIVNNLLKADAYAAAERLGIASADVTAAALGNAEAQERVNAALAEEGRLTAGKGAGRNSADIRAVTSAISDQSAAIEHDVEMWNLKQRAMGTFSGMSPRAIEHQEQLAASADDAAGAAGDLGGAYGDLAGDMEDTRTEGEKLLDMFKELTGAAIDADRASIDVQAALDDLRKSFKENGKTLDDNTEKGRANKDQVISTAEAIQKHIATMAEQGETVRAQRGAMRDHVADLRDIGENAGLTDRQIDKLIRRYGLVPKNIKTTVTANTSGAESALDRLIARAVSLENRKISLQVGSVPMRGRNRGGQVGGGYGTHDTEPTMLTRGEIVQQVPAVKKWGPDNLLDLNAGKVPPGWVIPGYNAGGMVGYQSGGQVSTSAGILALIQRLERLEDKRLRRMERQEARADRGDLARSVRRAGRVLDDAKPGRERREAAKAWREARKELRRYDREQREMRRRERHDRKIAKLERRADRLERQEDRAATIAENKARFLFDRMTPEQQLADLNKRIKGVRQYTDEWMRLQDQIDRLTASMMSTTATTTPIAQAAGFASGITGSAMSTANFAALQQIVGATGWGGVKTFQQTQTQTSTFNLYIDGTLVGQVVAPTVSEELRLDLVAQ